MTSIEYESIQVYCTQVVQGVLLGHPLLTISYTSPPLPTDPPQKRKLPDGEFCEG
jgi:hypothetical protein